MRDRRILRQLIALELDILRHLSRGMSDAEIAERVFISEKLSGTT